VLARNPKRVKSRGQRFRWQTSEPPASCPGAFFGHLPRIIDWPERRCGRCVVILNFSFKLIAGREGIWCKFTLFKTYRALSTAPVDVLWQKIINLADVSWNPLLSSTNAPRGLIAKPGLIYQVVTRLIPIPVRIFVERVRPGELLSVRFLAIPGVEKRVTYQIESTVCGTYVSYSVTLRGYHLSSGGGFAPTPHEWRLSWLKPQSR
jgi:hypothetical protein